MPQPILASLLAAAVLVLHPLAGHAESAQLIRAEPLRAQPSVGAHGFMDVARRTEVQVLETQNGWARVEAAGGRTGWLRDSSLDRDRATGTVAGSGQIFNGPGSGSNILRPLPRASQHALILTIGQASGTPSTVLAGSQADARLGAEIARLSGVPDANIRYRADSELDQDGLHQAFAELDAHMGNGDRAFIYLSAFGVHRQVSGRCGEAILAHDRSAFSFEDLIHHLQLLASKADKVFLVLDAGRGDGPTGVSTIAPRFARALSDPGCKATQPSVEFSRLPANVLILTASRPNENAGDTPAGGVFSQALHACLSGQSAPDSPSGLPTGEALISCSRQRLAAGPGTQHPGLAGNGDLALALQATDRTNRDARQVLRVIHAQRDQRRRVDVTQLSATAGSTRLRVSSSEAGYLYVLSADRNDFRLLYPAGSSQQMPIQRSTDIEIPLAAEKVGEWLVIVSDAIRKPGRAGFVSDGPSAWLRADAAGIDEVTQEFLSGDSSRTCLFSETRNLGPTQALACSSRFGAALLGTTHPK
ncbi:MAG: hypothetical protein JSR83_05810 [Proteobacteria bacterium]|nr:hypothetical protein [Pseudomonadota bacterium]